MSAALSPAVIFRRRSGWEAADLGVFLWRKNMLPIMLFMGIPSALLVSAYAAAVRLGFEGTPQIAAMFIWWLKPLLDRFGLQVISVRFFEPRSSIRALFKNLGRTLRAGLLGDLLWRRFSLYRSARMPLLILERPKRKTYKRRKQLLTRNGLGFGLPLTLICTGMFTALNFGELIFLQSMFNNFKDSYRSFFDFMNDETLLVSVVFYINMILTEMLYVCMGFSLYINSRVETEGWDIELLFKTCVEKAERKLRRKPAVVIAVLALIFIFTARPPAWTQQNTAGRNIAPETLTPAPISEESAKTLETILDGPEFGVEKFSKKIQFKKPDNPRAPAIGDRMFSLPDMEEILGVILRFVLGAALIAALSVAVYFAYRHRDRLFPARGGGKSRVDGTMLPDEPALLLQKAEELHRKGKIREAWALCFKTFTGIFAGRWFIPVSEEATEYETLALVQKEISAAAFTTPRTASLSGTAEHIKGFEQFVRRWILFAYGGKEPGAGTFEEAAASCRALLESEAGA